MTITRQSQSIEKIARVPNWFPSYGTKTSSSKERKYPRQSTMVLPNEVLSYCLSFLDGESLLSSGSVCVSWDRMSQQRNTWKNICNKRWPTTKLQILPQLPGAPDYDLIRLYGGCWKRCFTQGNKKYQRAGLSVDIKPFAKGGDERIVSETITVGEHHFCLWIFPRGNPHESEYSGRVLSVYLVITDLQDRKVGWGTCAVFTLSVKNHHDSSATLEWNSSLADNKFDKTLFNWGVHSLGRLDTLLERSNGFLKEDTLTVSVQVRLMSITFRVVLEEALKQNHSFGIAQTGGSFAIELPFCCTLNDLILAIQKELDCRAQDLRIWCFNQPVTNGKALRPRKLIWPTSSITTDQTLFADVLTDGIDIDAYSVCQIYVENLLKDDRPLQLSSFTSSPISTTSTTTITATHGYIFIKFLDPVNNVLRYIGRAVLTPNLSTADLYAFAASKCEYSPDLLKMYREEMLPIMLSEMIPCSTIPLMSSGNGVVPCCLFEGDIVIFEHSMSTFLLRTTLKHLLENLYAQAHYLATKKIGMLTLEDIENISEKLDIPKFRVRSAFRKCNEDPRKALEYIMEGRHLGFICDNCGETDFRGVRFNCNVCNDYDLCSTCQGEHQHVSHRYANIQGKWQKQCDFTDHSSLHSMKEINAVFCNVKF